MLCAYVLKQWWRRKSPDSLQLEKSAFAATLAFQKAKMFTACFLFLTFKAIITRDKLCFLYNNGVFITVYINIYDITDLRTLSIIVASLEGVSPWT